MRTTVTCSATATRPQASAVVPRAMLRGGWRRSSPNAYSIGGTVGWQSSRSRRAVADRYGRSQLCATPSGLSCGDINRDSDSGVLAAAAPVSPTGGPTTAWKHSSARLLGAAIIAAGALSLFGAPAALAQAGATPVAELAAATVAVSAGDTAWVLTSTALVLFMTIPGLSLFYAGLVRQKNVLSVLMQCFSLTALMTVLWAVCGYSLSFSTAGMQEGVVNAASFIGNLDKAFLAGVTLDSVTGTIPEALWVMFQMTFAIITPGLIVGAFAERMKFSAMMLFTALWAVVVYFPAAHAVWGGAGSFFGDMGVMDFAGGIVVHITAGIAALVACIMVGPRKSNSMEPHNLAMTVTGTGMLWVGWFGFNGGSAVAAGAAAAMAMAVTQISAAMAALVWMFLDCTDPEVARPSVLGTCTGAIAGLAAITPASGFVGPLGAFVIGTVSAIVCRFFATTVKSTCAALPRIPLWLHRFGYDDSLDVFGVHGVGGFIGTVLVAIFASTQYGGFSADLDIMKQLGVQLFAAAATTAYTVVATFGVLKVCDVVCNGLRVDAEEEVAGLDAGTHGEAGYKMASTMLPAQA